MEPQEFILSKLEELKNFQGVHVDPEALVGEVVTRILSKKFRKYSVDDAFREHVQKVVEGAVAKDEPINMVWVFGGYKLWRVPTAPNVDWGELFSVIYFAKYAKTIGEVYKPGVVFDFYSDDVIVSQMDNIPQHDINAYQTGFRKILSFVRQYLPDNVRLEYHRVADQYGTGEFDKELDANIDKLKKELPGGLPVMDEVRKALVELNVKLMPDQDKDPQWREKVLLVHDAYALTSKRRPYYRNENKIMIVNTPLKGALAIGTTKASVAKYWCGMGVLEKRGDSYVEKILSPKQLYTSVIDYIQINIEGLNGDNFKQICVLY